MIKEKAPAPLQQGSGARSEKRGNPTPSLFTGARRDEAADRADSGALADPGALADLVLDLVSETMKVEARLISAGFHNPARLLDAGMAADLRADDFADPFFQCCYCALWESVNFPGADVLKGIEAAAREWEVWIPEYGIQNFLEWRVFPLEVDASNSEEYARLVKRAARRRKRYSRLWRGLIDHVKTERDRLAAACSATSTASKRTITIRRARRAE